ncbi:hypothetical protein H0H93_008738 [Arthromyces matolae]|nr:hypothetical protein H0H93_008738 [Arthromyces matolae]
MKITLVNFLFLVIFALAASSIPVSPAQAPSTRHTSETGEVTYAIGGRHYSHDHIDYQVTLLQLVKSQGITLNNLVETERRAFEGIRLDFMDELGELTTEHYDKNRFEVHQFMVLLIDSLLPGTSLHTNDATVQSIARNALQTCLELEKKNNHTYDDVYPITAGHPLENQGYLGALKGKLEPPHGTKRRASDTPSELLFIDLRCVRTSLTKLQGDGNSGEDNGYLSKTRRLFGHFSGQDKHDGDDVHMSG